MSAASATRARRGLAALALPAIGFIWWVLATTPSPGKIFGVYPAERFVFLLTATYVLCWGLYFAASRGPKRLKATRFGLTTSALLVFFAVLELPAALGLVDYRVVIPLVGRILSDTDPLANPANQLDRELGHLHRPGRRFVGETAGDLVYGLGIPTDRRYQFDVQYDSRGFRNDHEIEQAPVVVVGDSFVEAGLVPYSALLSTRLGRLLDAEVANLGQGAYGPQQELVVLRRYGLPLNPKIVLWFFFEGNDLVDAQRYERLIASVELHDFKERSFAKNALLALARLTAPPPRGDADEARRRSCRLTEDGETLYFGYAGSPLSTEELASLQIAQQYFLEARRLASENGAELVFVYVPTKFRVYHDLCEPSEDGLIKEWQLSDLPSRLEGWCKTHGIAYLDLTTALKGAAASGDLVYYPDDTHWNARGNDVGARAIADFLRRSGRLEEIEAVARSRARSIGTPMTSR